MPTMRFFASLRDAAGCDRTTVEATTAGDAVRAASDRFGPAFAQIAARCAVVIGDDHIPMRMLDTQPVGDSDEMALLPPVSGGAQMIDVGDKEETQREATAGCVLRTTPETARRILAADLPKGDAIATARIAGIQAVKRTPDLIPLCHPVRTTSAKVKIEADGDDGISVQVTVKGVDRTGFEMEALVGASTAALTIYDMTKQIEPQIRIEGLRLLAKSGGKSGSVTFP